MSYIPVVWVGLFFSFSFFLLLFMMVLWMLAESVTAWFVNFNTKSHLNLVKIYTALCKPDTSLYHVDSPDTHFFSHYAAEPDYNTWYILLPYNISDLTSFHQPVLLPDTLPPLPLALLLSFIIFSSALEDLCTTQLLHPREVCAWDMPDTPDVPDSSCFATW